MVQSFIDARTLTPSGILAGLSDLQEKIGSGSIYDFLIVLDENIALLVDIRTHNALI